MFRNNSISRVDRKRKRTRGRVQVARKRPRKQTSLRTFILFFAKRFCYFFPPVPKCRAVFKLPKKRK